MFACDKNSGKKPPDFEPGEFFRRSVYGLLKNKLTYSFFLGFVIK